MLVPEGRFGFDALANQTQGQILHVPEDGSDEAPYVEALMEISDQLSRQYVLSVPAAALQGGGQIDILTRPGHLWVELGQLPHKGALGIFADERADEDCPSFVMVSADAGVHVSERCGTAWRALDQEMGEGPFKAALKQDEAVMVLSAAGELYEVDAQSGQVTKVALDMARLADIALGAQDELFLIGQSEAGAPWSLMSLDFRGEAELAPLVAVVEGAPAPVPVIHPARSRKCALVSHASMVCVEPEREAFTVNVAGISEEMFSRGLRVLPVPDRPGVFLGLVGDGRILRSFGDGARWVEVAPAVGQGRDLVFVPGQHAVACAASTTAMLCSEDAGLTWFEVGRRFDEEDQSAMASVGQRLYMAQNGQLQRLERVVNREIPSTTVYFATNARSPQANMLPFLQEVADAMRRDSSLVLRVEGHADHRGSTEYNEELAADRADSIIDIIEGAGIARPRLQSVSYGERRPVRSGTSGDALAVNRRVEIILMRPDIRLGGVQDPCREP